jgi:CBS domain-containing protein
VSFHLSLNTDLVTAAYPKNPLMVSPGEKIGGVLQLMRVNRSGSVLVCDESRLVGIFTERDALAWMASGQPTDVAIETLMSRDLKTLDTTATVADAIRIMSQGGYRRLPIMSTDGKPSGVSSVRGIVHYLVDHFPQTIYTLPPQPNGVTSEREGA